MIRVSVSLEGHDRVDAFLDRLAYPDLLPLAKSIERRLEEGNRRGLEDGTDANGKAFAPLAPSTLADRRRGAGGPMIPISPGRRFVEGFDTDIRPLGHGHEVIGSWDGVAAYHRTEARTRNPEIRRPARDVVGVRPADWARIGDDVRAFAEGLVRL